MNGSGKHTSLLWYINNEGIKKLYITGPWGWPPARRNTVVSNYVATLGQYEQYSMHTCTLILTFLISAQCCNIISSYSHGVKRSSWCCIIGPVLRQVQNCPFGCIWAICQACMHALLNLVHNDPAMQHHRLLKPWSSSAEGVDVVSLGWYQNRFRITHLAAYEHYAMHTCMLFLTCLILAQPHNIIAS